MSQVRQGATGANAALPMSGEVRWPPFATYRGLATLALANLADLQGRHEQAVPLYQELVVAARNLDMPRIGEVQYFDLAGYVGSLIESPYVGGIAESLREFRYRRFLLWSEAPEAIRKLALEKGGA